MPTVWKIAPGTRAENWDLCREAHCIAVGWDRIGDFEQYRDESAILSALKRKYGKRKGCGKGAARTIWRFVHVIKPDDIVIANRGESEIVGIGVVREGGYLHADHPNNPLPVPAMGEWWRRNALLVDWRIRQAVDVRKKNFFVAATVQQLTQEQGERIKKAYLKQYPKLRATLDELLDVTNQTEDAGNYPSSQGASASDIEGMKAEVVQMKSKRSRRLRRLAFLSANGMCVVCDRDFSKLLGGRGVRVLQVHHKKQLSSRSAPSVTRVADLAVVCANCHMLLHLDSAKSLTVEKLRRMLVQDGSKGTA